MKYGSLFSGVGLGDFGFELASLDLIWQIEYDPYCRKILDLRWPDVKKFGDIKEVNPDELGAVDLITGGFPCQPFSIAGKRKGKDDNRYLWPEMLRIIKAKKPAWVVGENVPGIINLALDTVCSDLEAEGYEVWPIVFPSHALGAWHKRDRLWIICYSEHNGQLASEKQRSLGERSNDKQEGEKQTSKPTRSSEQFSSVANTRRSHGKRNYSKLEAKKKEWCFGELSIESGCERFRRFWKVESRLGRVADGIANRVDRLKALGNGQTVCCTYVIGKMIKEAWAGKDGES